MTSWQLEWFGPLARLILTRPPINALDEEALDQLEAALGEVCSARAARGLVITGGTGNIFCSGGDLKYWRGIRDGGHVSDRGRKVFERLERLRVPTIAAINGSVIGDGLALALACDLRIAADNALFRLPELGYGFIPGWGPIRPLIAAIGRSEATLMLLTGRPYDASRALEIGLVHEVVAAGTLQETAMARAGAVAAASGAAVQAAKCALRGGDERACFQEVWGAPDWEEGIEALLAKRAPNFDGRR